MHGKRAESDRMLPVRNVGQNVVEGTVHMASGNASEAHAACEHSALRHRIITVNAQLTLL